MKRDVLDMVEGVLEHDALPGAEGRHRARRGAAGGQLDRRIDQLHHLGGFGGDPAVFGRGLVLHLPRAVHLVAEAPELHAVRLGPAMLAAQVGERRAAGMVAVFDQMARRIGAARAEVDREHRLDAGGAAPVDELVGSEGVRLGRLPGQVQAARALLDGADAVLPVVAGDEVAARVAHDGGRELAHQLEHVAAEAARVGGGVAGLVDPAIDAAAEMLDEGAEQAAVGLADGKVAVEKNLRCRAWACFLELC